MKTKELFIEQYRACYDEENWFVPLMNTVKDLTSEQAGWKKNGIDHSIFQLVNHLIYWNERYLLRFKSLPLPEAKNENDLTFDNSNTDWKATLKKLEEVLSSFLDEIRKADERKLNSSPFKESDNPWYSIIANIIAHNAYHTGQIVLIRKLQGSWK